VPVAVNCCEIPNATVGLVGVTAMETNAGAEMVSVVVALTLPDVAVIVTVPCVLLVASPDALMLAEPVPAVVVHVTVAVKFWVELSLYVPVAVNCCVLPRAILGVFGVTAIDTNAAAETVSVVLPVTLPDVAVIVTVPKLPPLVDASPEPLIVAEPVPLTRLQVTLPVTF
jgi:hypothetical protein